MSKRLHTVEIEGYGPVTIRALTKAQITRCRTEAKGDDALFRTQVLRRGCVEPNIAGMPDDEFLTEFEGKSAELAAIATAIIDRSWPKVDV